MKLNFSPFPELKTQRLVLRKIHFGDIEEILFLRSNKEVGKYIDRLPATSLKEVEAFLTKITKGMENGNNVNWSICLKDNDKMIGSICLWNFSEDQKTGEIGYDLMPSHQRKGIMSEALKSVLNFGFEELLLNKIEAYTHRENEASKHLLVKNNFRLLPNKKDEHNENNLIFELKK